MKKLLITLTILIPLIGSAQTRPTVYYDSLGNEYHNSPVLYYDSLGNEYHYDPTKIPQKKPSKKSYPKKTTHSKIVVSGRGRYTITY